MEILEEEYHRTLACQGLHELPRREKEDLPVGDVALVPEADQELEMRGQLIHRLGCDQAGDCRAQLAPAGR